MKGFIITYPQLEKYALVELKEYFENYDAIDDGLIVFDFDDFEMIEKFAYYCQSGFYVGYFFGSINELKLKDLILKRLKELNKLNYKIEVIHPRNVEINAEKRTQIIEKVKNKLNALGLIADPKEYDLTIITYQTKSNLYVGLSVFKDVALDKRSYKIYQVPRAIKGPLGFLMNSIAETFDKNNVLFAFIGDGILAIEYALNKLSLSPRYFDKMILNDNFLSFSGKKLDDFDVDNEIKRKICIATDTERKYLSFAEKNAQLAGVYDAINFTRLEVDWWDYKFQQDQFDAIVALPPLFNSSYTKTKIKKFFDEMFYQIEFILKQNSTFVMLSKTANRDLIKELCKKWNFSLEVIPFDFRQDVEILKMINNKKENNNENVS